MTEEQKARFEAFKARMRKWEEEELVAHFNREVGNNGWVSSRALYLVAMHQEFIRRRIDFSAVGDLNGLRLDRKVRLEGKKLVPVPKGGEEAGT